MGRTERLKERVHDRYKVKPGYEYNMIIYMSLCFISVARLLQPVLKFSDWESKQWITAAVCVD